jgi:hypothetical protein
LYLRDARRTDLAAECLRCSRCSRKPGRSYVPVDTRI